MKNGRGAYHKLDAKKFVRAWQTSNTLLDAMRKYGWKKRATTFASAACNLRRRGVSLKFFKEGRVRQPEHDYAGLAKLARSYSK